MATRRAYRLASIRDFTGGLNLRADQFTLGPNESPSIVNMDVDPRGGVRLRGGTTLWSTTALAGDLTGIGALYTSAGIAQLLAAVSATGAVQYGTGGAWSTAYTDATGIGLQHAFAVFNNRAYVQNGVSAARRWDGTTATALGTAFNSNLAAPTGGNMVPSKCVASHGGYLWIANTLESAVNQRNRVRWSHPNQPEDWRSADYIDIAVGSDGDEITALVPDGDRLLVFKSKSVHAIYGYDASSFFVQTLSETVGTPNAYSVCRSPEGVWFWNAQDGVYLAQGNKLMWQFDRLKPALDDGSISGTQRLAWLNRRLWVSCTYKGAPGTFVFDPTVGKRGAWTRYSINVGFMLAFTSAGSTIGLAVNSSSYVMRVDQSGTVTDVVSAAVTQPFESSFVTAWLDGGMPAIKKRWARTRTVVLADSACTLGLDIYLDYDGSAPRRTSSISVSGIAGALTWGTGLWGTGTWAAVGNRFDIERNIGGGAATAIQYRVSGPATTAKWGIDAIVATYKIKNIR